jgi:hypothetical protein
MIAGKVCCCAVLLSAFIMTAESQVLSGGNVSVTADENGFYADIAPTLGYQIQIVRMGVNPFISYSDLKTEEAVYSFGGRLYAEVTLLKGVFAHGEIEVSNTEVQTYDVWDQLLKERKWSVGIPLGAGYEYPIGEHMTAYGMILYDLLENEDSPQTNPIIRAGVNYNF